VAAALGAAAALSLFYLLHQAQWLRRVDVDLPVTDLPPDLDGLTVVQLSDFHAGFWPSFNMRAASRAVTMALEARPDLIVISGDLACGRHHLDDLARELARLEAPLGVYAVAGNHDHGQSKAPFVEEVDLGFLADCGVRLLVNECVTVRRGEAAVQVCGIDDWETGLADLPAVLARLDRRPGVVRLLLSHHADAVLATQPDDFAMMFSGDTHGGQICLPLPGRRILLSDLKARYAEGAYDAGGRPLYVTRGVGTSLLPFRAFCRPEIVVFHTTRG
jgi:predicted MPP superfamily phosphohydrolase